MLENLAKDKHSFHKLIKEHKYNNGGTKVIKPYIGKIPFSQNLTIQIWKGASPSKNTNILIKQAIADMV